MDQVDNIAQAINEMPTAGMIPVVLALITGLLLWAAGRKILLAAFGAIGFVIGVTAGWLIGELIGLQGMEIWIPTIVGGAIFACVAALASRLVVALALALTLGIAAPLATMTISQMTDTSDSVQESSSPVTEDTLDDKQQDVGDFFRNPDPDAIAETPPSEEDFGIPPGELSSTNLPLALGAEALGESLEIPEDALRYVDHIKHIANQLLTSVETHWQETPSTSRAIVVASGIAGLLLGMLLGVLARNFSTVVVTAFSGSLLWLGCAWTLANNFGVSDGPWMPGSSASWLVWWMVTAVIGLVIQWTLYRKRADKSAN